MTSTSIIQTSQGLETGDLVALFTLDLRPIGVQEIWHFTANRVSPVPDGDDGFVKFGGVSYAPVDLEVDGFEMNGSGQIPQPKIKISNAAKFMSGLALAHQDLVGAELTRVRTYCKYLDGQPTADPAAMYAADIYVIEQKTGHDKFFIEFTLAAAMDQQGRMLPGRQILRNTCTWRYRVWDANTGTFSYSNVTCPYTGNKFFDYKGVVQTEPSHDQCGKRLSDCKKRFGNKVALPYGGFPGVTRIRV